jgi:hypothetical protein
VLLVVLVSAAVGSCGKKGPPLPPLVRLPAAPADLMAVRRSNVVDLQFTVPSANTDNTRPANVMRVDVYALTGPAAVSEAEVVARGTPIASVAVKAPRDPDDTYDPNDPDQSEADVEAPEGEGLDQGVVARVRETLAIEPAADGSPGSVDVRTYVGVGITTGGRPGPMSRRAVVPLAPAPSPPGPPAAAYTESAVTLTWPPSSESADVAYNVYEAPPPGAAFDNAAAAPTEPVDGRPDGPGEVQLTSTPVAGTEYADARMVWGATRCYAVRTVAQVDALSIESDASPPACVTLVDTFPPAAPRGLQAVATEGVINLIWEPNKEADLDGYFLLRAPAPGDELLPVMTAPFRETSFEDRVPAGIRYVYALQAVDRFGNLSTVSERIEETAR